MDKNAVFNYVEFAREELQKLVKQKAFEYGITDKEAKPAINGVVNGMVLSKEETIERESLISNIKLNCDGKDFSIGFNIIIEEVAYTWFNRFIALRFMEVNGFLPSHTRVFSDASGKFNPQILKEALTVDIKNVDRVLVSELLQNNKSEELFKYLIILQCNELSKPMPKMFEKISNYTELLFPNGLLKRGSIIDKLVRDIPEDNWKNQVQIIGWMYQFYVASKRKLVRDNKATKETIPTKSQVFTRDWIVRYLVDNSLGRIWNDISHSNHSNDLKYYIDEGEQPNEVKATIEALSYKNSSVESIKIIEPCSGSGHILVYCFDVLYKMYLEKGYAPKDIPSFILKNNLFGLDIDKRAFQLAYFSVMMKARSIDPTLFSKTQILEPNMYEIPDSKLLIDYNYELILKNHKFSDESISIASYLVNTFKDAKTLGSLIKVKKHNFKALLDELNRKESLEVQNIFESEVLQIIIDRLKQLCLVGEVLSNQYDLLVTNPPYIPIKEYDETFKIYANKYFKNSKNNMGIMFMETGLIKKNGYLALVNPEAWLFLTSYKELRKKLFKDNYIICLNRLGLGEFDAAIQTSAFVLRNMECNFTGVYLELTNERNREESFLARKQIYRLSHSLIDVTPENAVIFWLDEKVLKAFATGVPLSPVANPCTGLQTGDNGKFVRQWWEVSKDKIYFNASSSSEASESHYKWFPYNKGGDYRKWYGNNDCIVNWYNDGYEIKHNFNSDKKLLSRPQNTEYYFKSCITWSKISSGPIAFRYKPNGFIFDVAGTSIFSSDDRKLKYIFGLVNSSPILKIIKGISPTLNYEVGQISNIPIIFSNTYNDEVIKLVEENIKISKEDWDSFELSWDFVGHPLAKKPGLIEDNFKTYELEALNRFSILKKNEERINEIVLDIYNLKEMMDKEVDDYYVSVSKADYKSDIKSFISYCVGVVLGRFTKDFNGYNLDNNIKNSVLVLTEDGYFSNDGVSMIFNYISERFGSKFFESNIKYVSDALPGNDISKDKIRTYLINGFIKDHHQKYRSKSTGIKPIYWLLDAGPNNSFKAIMYPHSYDLNFFAKLRIDYIIPLLSKYSEHIKLLENEIPSLKDKALIKSQKELEKIKAQYKELIEYEQKIHNLADQRISINLDDGVKHNYELFKDVLAPLK